MSEFVKECLREWRRLGVPDSIANEMAADLSADLEEAAAEGGSPEDVLGNSAFEPRSFAAAWAAARGVSAPVVERRPLWRQRAVPAAAVVLGVLIIGTGLVVASGHASQSIAIHARRVIAVPGPVAPFPPGASRFVVGPFGPFVGAQGLWVDLRPIALLVFLACLLALAGLGAFALLRRSTVFTARRGRQQGGPTPGWG